MSQDAEKHKNEPAHLEGLRRKLKFRSWHRGTREMDMILGHFAEHYLDQFTHDQLCEFETLLSYSDPDLYNWLSGAEDLPAEVDSGVMRLFIQFKLTE